MTKRTCYFVDVYTTQLFFDTHMPGRFRSQPGKYREISKAQYDRLADMQNNHAARLGKYTNRHKGKTLHVFGNGPSLLDFAAWQNWREKLTVGVNAAGVHIKSLTYWISVDNLWDQRFERRDLYDWLGTWLKAVKGKTIQFLRRGATIDLHRHLRPEARGDTPCWEPDENFEQSIYPAKEVGHGLFWAYQSTQAAIDLCRHLGAAVIVVWGVDLHDRAHSYTGSKEIPKDVKDNPGHSWQHLDSIVEGYRVVGKACKEVGCRVVNANPKSRLDVFERVQPEDGFAL